MASDSDEDEFLGFDAEEAEQARVLRQQLSSDESDISVATDESSSESEDEREEVVWTTDESPVHVNNFVQPTEQPWTFSFFSGQKNCLLKLSKKRTEMLNSVFRQNLTQIGTQ